MKDFFKELFLYNYSQNEMFISLLQNTENMPISILHLISHILLVQQSWNQRMQGDKGLSDFWEIIPINLLQAKNMSEYEMTKNIIGNSEMNDIFSYKNSKGVKFTNTNKDVLFHIINHGTHHRGQINLHLKNCGIEPVILDYIFYKR